MWKKLRSGLKWYQPFTYPLHIHMGKLVIMPLCMNMDHNTKPCRLKKNNVMGFMAFTQTYDSGTYSRVYNCRPMLPRPKTYFKK